MFKRSIVRIAGTFVSLVAGVAVSARAALAANVPDPIGPTPGAGSGTDRLPAVPAPSTSFAILGMNWELALAVALFVIAAALFLGTALQRRHIAHV